MFRVQTFENVSEVATCKTKRFKAQKFKAKNICKTFLKMCVLFYKRPRPNIRNLSHFIGVVNGVTRQ